ncbi:hypothetical protein ACIBG4_41555 [Nonomuraea sp. NPDC050383]|uniref:zinc finger domain-containing protein n=1 Tax=Nonomuraea sp. NPDC050383 TaxID=3364362 RepID=UPI003791C27B
MHALAPGTSSWPPRGVHNDDFLRVEVHACPMTACAAPAGSPCRTGKGKVAVQYHTARFRLVPSLAKALNVPTPAIRAPGMAWLRLPRPAVADAEPTGHARIGYIRDRTLEGHESARARGKAIGGAAVTDEHMLSMALHLRAQNLSLRDIAARLVITSGAKGAVTLGRDRPAHAP